MQATSRFLILLLVSLVIKAKEDLQNGYWNKQCDLKETERQLKLTRSQLEEIINQQVEYKEIQNINHNSDKIAERGPEEKVFSGNQRLMERKCLDRFKLFFRNAILTQIKITSSIPFPTNIFRINEVFFNLLTITSRS